MPKGKPVTSPLPEPAKTEQRICFGIYYFDTKAKADKAAKIIREAGNTYNGGWYDGKPCGREKHFDYTDLELGQLYAVTF